jgi:integrase
LSCAEVFEELVTLVVMTAGRGDEKRGPCRTSSNDWSGAGVARPWSASGLAKAIKDVLERCAATMDPEDAKQLRKASTHWFRHTHGSHALNGRPGNKGVPIQIVQKQFGHASIGMTSGYLTTERDARLAAMKGFGAKVADRKSGK